MQTLCQTGKRPPRNKALDFAVGLLRRGKKPGLPPKDLDLRYGGVKDYRRN